MYRVKRKKSNRIPLRDDNTSFINFYVVGFFSIVDNILTAAVSFYIYNSFRFSLCCFKLVTHIHWPCFCRRLSECKVFKNLR